MNFTLTESLTDEYVTGARVIAVSNDGFGNVTLAPSDDGGNVSDQIMPGSWTLSLDKETGDKLWTINEGEYIFDATGDEDVELGVVEAELQVMIGGKIFWDWNENGMVDFTESIADVNVTISSTDGNVLHEVKTDELGVWFQSVPIMQTYNVSVEKSGYSSGYYQSNGTDGIIVNTSSVTEDLAIVADNVAVSGTVTSVMQDEAASLTDASITLYPETGREAEPIAISGVYENGQLTWSTSVEPGNWIVVVESQVKDDNTGGISIGYLNAGIEDGGDLAMVMSSGGYLHLESHWQDIQLADHHAGSDSSGSDKLTHPVEITIDTGLDATWNYTLDADGEVDLLLPVGDFEISSEFTTIQHQKNARYGIFW